MRLFWLGLALAMMPIFGLSAAPNKGVPDPPIVDRLTRVCEPGDDDRASDLCAQWKAADSAAAASQAAWIFGVAGSTIGLFTLLAATAAAFFAQRTWRAAENSNRAWLVIRNVRLLGGQVLESEGHPRRMLLRCTYELENVGRSPAVQIAFLEEPLAYPCSDQSKKYAEEWMEKRGKRIGTYAIAPQQLIEKPDIFSVGLYPEPQAFPNDSVRNALERGFGIILSINYRSASKRLSKVHRVAGVFLFGGVEFEGETEDKVPEPLFGSSFRPFNVEGPYPERVGTRPPCELLMT